MLVPAETTGPISANWRRPERIFNGGSGNQSNQDILIESGQGSDVVNSIIIQIDLPLGDFVPLFGPPPSTGLRQLPGLNGNLFYMMEYRELGMQYLAWIKCKAGQEVSSLIGNTYVLQAPSGFISQLAPGENMGWHGFTSRPFDQMANQMAKQNECPSGESPLNQWFAQLFGS
jgi:hypothetical protein